MTVIDFAIVFKDRVRILKNTIFLFFLVTIIVFGAGCIETGKGSSTDTIYGIEYNGLIWPTYSIWLTHDNPSMSGKNSYSAIYTVDKNDKELVDQLYEVYNNGTKVKIYYRNEAFYEPWKYTSNAIALIYKVEYV